MRANIDRAVLIVSPHEGAWAVECEGERFDHTPDKEVAKASAHKRARQFQDAGRPCEVRIFGELGFYGGR